MKPQENKKVKAQGLIEEKNSNFLLFLCVDTARCPTAGFFSLHLFPSYSLLPTLTLPGEEQVGAGPARQVSPLWDLPPSGAAASPVGLCWVPQFGDELPWDRGCLVVGACDTQGWLRCHPSTHWDDVPHSQEGWGHCRVTLCSVGCWYLLKGWTLGSFPTVFQSFFNDSMVEWPHPPSTTPIPPSTSLLSPLFSRVPSIPNPTPWRQTGFPAWFSMVFPWFSSSSQTVPIPSPSS